MKGTRVMGRGGGAAGLLHESTKFRTNKHNVPQAKSTKKTTIQHIKVDVKTLKSQNSNHPNLKTSVFN
jgi:hypothetical protein